MEQKRYILIMVDRDSITYNNNHDKMASLFLWSSGLGTFDS